jgi:hypothetical protein
MGNGVGNGLLHACVEKPCTHNVVEGRVAGDISAWADDLVPAMVSAAAPATLSRSRRLNLEGILPALSSIYLALRSNSRFTSPSSGPAVRRV